MLNIQGNMTTGLAVVIQIIAFNAFAQEYGTPSIPFPGGHFNAQVEQERQEAIKQRDRKGLPEEGNGKSLLCQGCHGETGMSNDPFIPNLAGQYGNYIVKQVRNYQLGTRSHDIMSSMAATISDDDLFDAAAYYASQKTMSGNKPAGNPLGGKLFINAQLSDMGLACVNCHGEKGKGLEPKISAFPIIGGQNKDYIRSQLFNFRGEIRTNTPNNIMNRITKSLTDAQIEALAEYVSGQ